MKRIASIILLLCPLLIPVNGQTKSTQKSDRMNTEHYTFKQSEKVTRKKVSFKNRYGITLVADLYLP